MPRTFSVCLVASLTRAARLSLVILRPSRTRSGGRESKAAPAHATSPPRTPVAVVRPDSLGDGHFDGGAFEAGVEVQLGLQQRFLDGTAELPRT